MHNTHQNGISALQREADVFPYVSVKCPETSKSAQKELSDTRLEILPICGDRNLYQRNSLRDIKSKVQCNASKSLDAWGSIMNDVKKQNLMGAHHLLPQEQ